MQSHTLAARSRRFRRLYQLSLTMAVPALVGFTGGAEAAVTTLNSWNIVTGGSWNDANNWSALTVPDATQHALLGTNLPLGVSTITLDAAQTSYSFDGSPGPGGKTVAIDPGTSGSITLLS